MAELYTWARTIEVVGRTGPSSLRLDPSALGVEDARFCSPALVHDGAIHALVELTDTVETESYGARAWSRCALVRFPASWRETPQPELVPLRASDDEASPLLRGALLQAQWLGTTLLLMCEARDTRGAVVPGNMLQAIGMDGMVRWTLSGRDLPVPCQIEDFSPRSDPASLLLLGAALDAPHEPHVWCAAWPDPASPPQPWQARDDLEALYAAICDGAGATRRVVSSADQSMLYLIGHEAEPDAGTDSAPRSVCCVMNVTDHDTVAWRGEVARVPGVATGAGLGPDGTLWLTLWHPDQGTRCLTRPLASPHDPNGWTVAAQAPAQVFLAPSWGDAQGQLL